MPGGFFEALRHRPGSVPQLPWSPLSDLVDDPAVRDRRVRAVAGRLWPTGPAGPTSGTAAERLRVAGSVAQLGITARVLGPVMAAAVRGRPAPVRTLRDIWWQDRLDGPFPLSMPATSGGEPVPDAADWVRRLVDGPLSDLVAAFAGYPPSARIRWGNVASAVHGAAGELLRVWPDRGQQVAAVAAGLLDRPALRDAARGAAGTASFRRRSCCLIYRAPSAPPGVCGDCVLPGRPGIPPLTVQR